MAPVLFSGGVNFYAYDYLGAHMTERGGEYTYTFRLWAPNAKSVRVVGDFNKWDTNAEPMKNIGHGIWEKTIDGIPEYTGYKYLICKPDGKFTYKSDPVG